ncbi:MAG: hypothetical protein ABI904_18840 [Chloroflexota bacterium]
MSSKWMLFSTKVLLLILILISCTTKATPPINTLFAPTPIATLIPSITLTQTPALGCLPTESSVISVDGGILFYEQDASQLPITTRVWYWSNTAPSPQLILKHISSAPIYLSPDGKKLAWHEYDANHFTVYDLISKTYEYFPWQTEWQTITGWTKDGLISILVDYKAIYEKGVISKYAYYDVQTQSFTNKTLSLDLTGFTQDKSSRDPQDGFAVTDPTNSLVLFTSNEGSLGKLILLDTKSEQRLWEETAQYPFYPYPNWTSDGNQVAFVLYKDGRTIIYTLTRDGKNIKDVGEGSPRAVVREINWSLDDSYVYYANWKTIETGPAFIINIATKETKEICTQVGYSFLNGYWLPNNRFAYIVYKGEQDQPGVNELILLDIKGWTTNIVYQTITNKNQLHKLNFIGWTPITNP